MPYRKIFFAKDQPVHIVSRALTNVFREEDDCFRFIFQYYAVNLGRKDTNMKTKDMVKSGRALLRGEEIPEKFVIRSHPPLVHLLDFSLVGNHYHFYLLPTTDTAIPMLMHKLNDSFARSFNLLHGRKDALFGSRYKGVAIKDELQSYTVSRYVSIINPLDVFQPGWREKGLSNAKEAFNFLENYGFSSFPDKIRQRASLILAPQEILEQYAPFWGNGEEYREFVTEFLKEKANYPQSVFME
ncbi:MAG: hypothetical protein A2896_01235 [Candidatus Nealsonbacteria bacterium RIFCSPLOWO2_01_FULL_43_32]|uniref:Transposase IS200-like domain-containing protein n=1 Tax=Candidatus Nealsonbacteria bacterium RIFCSPLOWO2_01_FULL_43_32 TaxID=1801672 RepID=A0A1G2EFL2_9BACT|nr:MAG: hypothetical protein A2896_01235 [Candidatus Nealsonbacteria bacterium RIFCSPLOWO2_01_FULL_43_32]